MLAAICSSLSLPDKIFQPVLFSYCSFQLSSVCFKAVIQSSKIPEIALFSLKNRKNAPSAGVSAPRPFIRLAD